MNKIRILAVALALSWTPFEAFAAPPPAIRESVGVCDFNAPTHCAKPDGNGNLPTTTNALATGGALPYHYISTASTNSTLISTGAHTLYDLQITGLNTVAAYVRIYDTAGAPTCSSATGASHTYLVIGSATAQGGMVVPIPSQGEAYVNGLAFCITGGSADTDNTNAPVGVIVNAAFK